MRALLRVPRCSLLDIAALILPLWLVVIVSHTTADADLWGHLRFGSDFIAGRGLPAADPYSFTSDVAWINHEWLSEVIMAAAFALGGPLFLNLLKVTVIGAIAFIVWRTVARADASTRSASTRSAMVLTSLVVLVSYTRTQVLRPQLFSVLIFTMMLDLLGRSNPGSTRRWIGIPALFCIWSNVHGAWIVGFAVVCVWAAVEAGERPSTRSFSGAVGLALAAALATAVNPYGFTQWAFLRNTVGLSRTDITDWAPLLQLSPAVIALDSVLLVVAVISVFMSRRVPRSRHIAVIALLVLGTWRIGRVDAFLQIAIGVLLAPSLVDLFERVERRLATFDRVTATSALHGLAAVVLVAAICVAAARRLTQIPIEGPWAPDRDAVHFLRNDARDMRLLTWFDWGEYAIWHLSDAGIRVSMDGRRETVYSDRVLAAHWAFYRDAPDAWQYPDRIEADRIWLPATLPVVASLRSHGWRVAFESDRSLVLARRVNRPQVASSQGTPPRFFPEE